jgi:hypothetical protein
MTPPVAGRCVRRVARRLLLQADRQNVPLAALLGRRGAGARALYLQPLPVKILYQLRQFPAQRRRNRFVVGQKLHLDALGFLDHVEAD